MGKNTYFSGQPVYNQLIKLLDKSKIKEISQATPKSEAYVKKLEGYTHLIIMLFGVLKHFDSLRELEVDMKAEASKLAHLGIDYFVRRSTLAEANKRRPSEFFAQVYAHLLEQYGPFLADSHAKGDEKDRESFCTLSIQLPSAYSITFSKGLGGILKVERRKEA